MKIGVLGINHKSAEIGMREHVSKAVARKFALGSEAAQMYHCIVLSTCNRTEIYFSVENLADAHSDLLHFLREEIPVPFEHKLYSYFGLDCFVHLARVAAGLDSVIIAESEIQRQVKTAYEQTLLYYPLPSALHFLFQKSLRLGKQIRSMQSISQNQTSIPKILYQISEQLFKNIAQAPLLFIGNSEINRKVMALFKRKGAENLFLCTRSPHAAKEMADKERIQLLGWEKLRCWEEFPIVICGTNAPHYLIREPNETLKTWLIFDLSVPRNVDPALARHPRLTLLNMEELSAVIEKKQEKNQVEIGRAEAIVQDKAMQYLHAFHEKQSLTCC